MRTCPATQGDARHGLANEAAQFICVFDAARRTVALITTQHYQRTKTQGVGPLCKFKTIFERMLRCQDGNNPRPVCFGPEIDRHVPEIGLLASSNRSVGHEHKTAE